MPLRAPGGLAHGLLGDAAQRAMRAAITEPSASTENTARSRREPCPWRKVVKSRLRRAVTGGTYGCHRTAVI